VASEPRLLRVARFTTPEVALTIDGRAISAHQGESVLSAMLGAGDHLRRLDIDGEKRAGFCLMGACQDCWVWFGPQERGRACSTPVAEGMTLFTAPPEAMP